MEREMRNLGLILSGVVLLCVTLVSNRLAAQTAGPNTRSVAIRAARLIDGKGETVVKDAVVIVEGDTITAVGSVLPIPAGATVIDLGDMTLLPGLIDAHTHLLLQLDGTDVTAPDAGMLQFVARTSTAERALLGAKFGREDLESGITTVRDLGNSGVNGDVALRTAIDGGWLPGPRIVASTRALMPQGGQFGRLTPAAQPLIEEEYVTIRGAESARQAVRQALYDGAGCIKVIVNGTPANVTLEEMKAIVEEAHTVGIKVAAHAIGDQATKIAAEAGVDSIEHAYVVDDAVLKMMAEKHIYLVPTDGTLETLEDMTLGTRQPSADERNKVAKDVKPLWEQQQERLKRAMSMGVPIAAGSDMCVTIRGKNRGQASVLVYEAYAEAGMKPMDIIYAATRNAADLLGMQKEVGTLEPGKLADIIAVPGNPLQDIKTLEHAGFVMKGGTVVVNHKQKNCAGLNDSARN
jgi:imidazolonepropionase-like amidohydrolase